MLGLGETAAIVAVVIGTVTVFGMLLDGYKARMRVREREVELQIARLGAAPSAPAEPADPEVERLEARLRVLERLATDKAVHLSAQIEDLRQPAI